MYTTRLQIRYMLETEWEEHRITIPVPTVMGWVIVASIGLSIAELLRGRHA